MYPVSNAYLQAMHSPTQHHRIKIGWQFGIIQTDLTDEDIEAGSFEYVNQCCDANELGFGGVYVGYVKFNLLRSTFLQNVRFSMVGMVLPVTFSLLVDEENDTWEDVPIGLFTITEAVWTESSVKITAYDYMAKFDETANLDGVVGIPWQIIKAICSKVHVTFANTAVSMQDFPNANEVIGLYSENDIKTYRDMLSRICQAAGCFATINRRGELEVRRFGRPNNPVDTIDTSHRLTGSTFSDYITNYTSVSDTGTDGEDEFWHRDQNNGVNVPLNGNPFLYYGDGITRDRYHLALVDEVLTWKYTPFTSSMLGNPAYDLGDVLAFTGGIASNDKCVITKIDWKYKRTYSVSGVGANPLLSKSAGGSSSSMSRIERANQANTIRYLSYQNAADIYFTVNDGEVTVLSLDFATTKDTQVELWLQANANFFYNYGTVPFPKLKMRVYVDGEQELEMVQSLPAQEALRDNNQLLNIPLMFYTLASSDIRHAVMVTFELDDEPLTPSILSIDAGSLRALLKGQGLSMESPWDGSIRLEDALGFQIEVELALANLTESDVNVTLQIPTKIELSDSISDDYSISLDVPGMEEGLLLVSLLDPSYINFAGDDVYAADDFLI